MGNSAATEIGQQRSIGQVKFIKVDGVVYNCNELLQNIRTKLSKDVHLLGEEDRAEVMEKLKKQWAEYQTILIRRTIKIQKTKTIK